MLKELEELVAVFKKVEDSYHYCIYTKVLEEKDDAPAP